MIAVLLQGGLGNQMFQYAAARALAEKNRTEATLNLSWFEQDFQGGPTAREYELDCFQLDTHTTRNNTKFIGRLRQKFIHHYSEPHFHYDKHFFELPASVVLSGYFQSEKYFRDYRPDLLSDFVWVKPPTGKNQKFLKSIQADYSSVSIHVRRGDYVANKSAAKFHGLTTIEYYQTALKYLKQSVSKPNLYIFSDDPDWCKKNLKFADPTTYVSHNTDGSEDMRLMKSCRHNIIANSSFSWWGAWLNTNPTKIVIGPRTWFANKGSNTKDVIPDKWITI